MSLEEPALRSELELLVIHNILSEDARIQRIDASYVMYTHVGGEWTRRGPTSLAPVLDSC